VLAAFDISYRGQPDAARRVFRLLGLVPGPDFTVEAAAALAGIAVPEADALLDGLTRTHLVQRSAKGRFSLHDLLRHFAHDRVAADPDRAEATDRLLDYHLAATDAAAARLYPYMFRLGISDPITARAPTFSNDGAAIGWLDGERPNIIAAIRAARGPRPRKACALAVALQGYLWFRGHVVDAVQTADAALGAAADDGTIEARAGAEITAAMAYHNVGDQTRAARHGETAVRLARRAGIKSAEAPALANLGPILLRAGDPAGAIERTLNALALARQCRRPTAEGSLLADLTVAYRELGRLRDAADSARAAVAIHRQRQSLVNECQALTYLGEVCRLLGELDEAATHLQRSLAIASQIGNRAFEAPALATHAVVLAEQGRLAKATDTAMAALMAMTDQDHWSEVECRNTLGSVMSCVGRHGDAVNEHTRALELIGGADHAAPAVVALIGLSNAYRVLGETREAAACAAEALQTSTAVGYRMLEGQAHVATAQLALVEGRAAAAASHAWQAIELQHGIGHRLGEARAKVVAGHANSPERMTYWRHAFAIFEQCGAKREATATLALLKHGAAEA
jgi:tetratricopeptide (TPR) repeat protein